MLRHLAAAARNTIALAGLSGLVTAFAAPKVSRRSQAAPPAIVEPARITVEDHWHRVTGIVAAAVAGFRRVESLHAAATAQLDSADYALMQVLHDLRPVMALPTDVSGLRAILAEAERMVPERPRRALAA